MTPPQPQRTHDPQHPSPPPEDPAPAPGPDGACGPHRDEQANRGGSVPAQRSEAGTATYGATVRELRAEDAEGERLKPRKHGRAEDASATTAHARHIDHLRGMITTMGDAAYSFSARFVGRRKTEASLLVIAAANYRVIDDEKEAAYHATTTIATSI